MSKSSHRDDFFQSSAALDDQWRRDIKSRNTNGNPIRLQSKILAIQSDPMGTECVFVAQSSGIVRKVVLETGETVAVFKGPTAPITSICFTADGSLLFGGCWDKTIWSWDVASRKLRRRYEGHSDFVKSVICAKLGDRDLLISGGADAQVQVFDVASGARLSSLKDHIRGIQHLEIDHHAHGPKSPLALYIAGSDREIRGFSISDEGKDLCVTSSLLAHDTSVYKVRFDSDGDLWTASADKTTKCLVREDNWKANLILEHPDFVRDVALYEQGGWVITACRDEEVRVWNRSTGDLHHTFSGHFEEVTGLLMIDSTVVSVSIDATIRQWSLRADELQSSIEKAKNAKEVDKEANSRPEAMLTEEEERELAELMDE